MSHMRPSRLTLLPFLLITGILMVLPIAFLWLHLTTPFDGGRLMPDSFPITAEGLRVTPPKALPGGLQAGDVVTAVEGQPIQWWAEALFTAEAPSPPWETNPNPRYTVLRNGQEVEVVVTPTTYPLGAILRSNWGLIVFGVIFLLVAGYVLIQRPQLLPARLLFLTAASVFSASTWSLGLQVTDFLDSRGFWLYQATTIIAYQLYWIAGLHFTLAFPRPLPITARRGFVYALYGLPYLLLGVYLLARRNNSANVLSWIASWERASQFYALIFLIMTLLVATWQYRTSRHGADRQQVKWVILAGLVSGGLALLLYALPPFLGAQPANTNLIGLIVVVFPLALAAAILRYRLFDIDVLIRRTLVYTVLSALLALLYFGSVVLLQYLLTDLIGAGSSIAVVVSTLLIAALFTPLRRRVQDTIDRRFYRRRYDAQQVLATFAAAARNETDPDQLTAELVRVVQETMQPAHVSLTVVRFPTDSHLGR
jgi:hypothetical protein